MSQAKLSGFDLKVYMYTHIGYIKTSWLQEDVSLKRETFQNGSHLSPKPLSVRCMVVMSPIKEMRNDTRFSITTFHLV